MTKQHLISDTECYPNFWSIGFKRTSDGKTRVYEHSARKPITEEEREQIRAFLRQNITVGYNFINYDAPMIAVMLDGADNARLKAANDSIIVGGMKHWQSENVLGVSVPRSWEITDLMEPQPNAFASLKTLAGRLHAPKMQDLPYAPDHWLSEAEMDEVLSYMGNDLDNTHLLFDALKEPLALREAIGAEYGINVMSKSDAQIGEAIIKAVVEKETGQRIYKPEITPGITFRYTPPEYLKFKNPELTELLDRLRTTDFMIKRDGKVDLPEWIANRKITIGETAYAIGIGGLHSTESNRSVFADEEAALYDVDVAGFYPEIFIKSGLYPPAIGPLFCAIFEKLKRERDRDKPKLKDPTIPKEDLPRLTASVEGKKIVGNGVFGKTSSQYSILWAPRLTIFTTLTGQLSVLMLIDHIEDAGMGVISANTDGIVIRCPRAMGSSIERDRFTGSRIKALVEEWEQQSGYVLEATEYASLHSQSVNLYLAVKPDGKVKQKGPIANPWATGDIRGQLMKNPQMSILTDAVIAHILHDTPIETTIRASRDVRDFVTVVKVDGGATWRGEYLGKVVRYIWAKGGEEILRAKPHATTGNHAKVPKSDGCRPLMNLPAVFPDDIDYAAYEQAAREILMDIGYTRRPAKVKPLKLFSYNAMLWWALAA